VDEKLGRDQPALAFVGEDVNWDAVTTSMASFDGEQVYATLKGDSLVRLEELTEDENVTAEAEEAFEEIDTE
jgi:hypothetical protein